MADFFTWDPAILSVKVPEMDAEHQVLIQKMNKLHSCYKDNLGREQIKPLLDDFVKYVVTHFSDEEKYMERVKFPGLETHKLIHVSLLKQAGEYLAAFEKEGKLSDGFFNFLAVWLTSHIRGIDRKYST